MRAPGLLSSGFGPKKPYPQVLQTVVLIIKKNGSPFELFGTHVRVVEVPIRFGTC